MIIYAEQQQGRCTENPQSMWLNEQYNLEAPRHNDTTNNQPGFQRESSVYLL